MAVILFGLAGCGGGGSNDGGDSSNAHINEASGSANGVILDERTGIPPPPVKDPNLRKAARDAGCYLLRNLKPEGNKELPPNGPTPEYKEDPPTSGPHVRVPHQQADGAYLVGPEPSAVVAALDHGRLAIQYAPDFRESAQLELKGIFDTMYGGTLFFPNETMEFAVAATTWTNLLACTGWEGQKTLDAVRDFGRATWGKYGSGSLQQFPVEGPTPANPEEPGATK
ncbi:MAG TPA: DUF3105 domain-containing protein [Solirubrobacterales bacterium]|nr:DUF3105 domain-containing protein [Solirubrobacterales bacterium]